MRAVSGYVPRKSLATSVQLWAGLARKQKQNKKSCPPETLHKRLCQNQERNLAGGTHKKELRWSSNRKKTGICTWPEGGRGRR